MQQPLPRATSTPLPTTALPDPSQGQTIDRNKPDISRPYRGWYPRWWLLSGFFCSLFIGLWTVMEHFLCGPTTTNVLLCQIHTWTDWRQYLPVVFIWLLFLFGWFVAFILGTGPLEISKQKNDPIANFLRVISDFQPVYSMLLFLGGLAFCCIVVSWFFSLFQPTAFALASLLLFVANSCFLYKRHPSDRRSYLVGYGVVALAGILFMLFLRRFQFMLFISELIVIAIAIRNLRPVSDPTQQVGGAVAASNPYDNLANEIATTISPGQLFKDLFQSRSRNRNIQDTTAPTAQDAATTQTFASQPTQNVADQTTQNFTNQPTQNLANQPTQNFTNQPTQNLANQPTQNMQKSSTQPLP